MDTQDKIKQYIATVEGVVALFNPFIEAAIHDLTTGKIAALYNNMSKRKVGDPSPLQELNMPLEKFPDVFDPYYKTNWDGRKLKCTSITIRDDIGRPIALICFNLDTTVFRDIELNLKTLLEVKRNAENPIELFSEDWQKKTDTFISSHLSKKNLLISNLTGGQKKELVQELASHGVLNYKNAAPYIAGQLHISRASVYNYIK